jgi:hypothetical protein
MFNEGNSLKDKLFFFITGYLTSLGFILWGKGGGGGGGNQAPQQVTNVTSNLPEYAKPWFENLLKRSQAESYRDYTPYEGDRIATFNPAEQAIHQEVLGLQTPTAFRSAADTGIAAGQAGLAGALGDTQNYMSPYIEGALDPQLRNLQRASNLQDRDLALQAARQGGRGGSREAFMRSELQRNTAQNQADVLGKGYQTAYEQALARQRDLGSLGIQGLTTGIAGGQAEQAGDMSRLAAQEAIAGKQRDMEQQQLQMSYEDFLRQRDYPKEQLGFYSNMLRGLPVQLASTQTTYQAPQSVASQLGGLGLGALGLSKIMGKG